MWDCESSHSLPLCRWSTCPRWTMKVPDQLLHAKENSWQFLMATAELQLQPMLIVIRMGVVHSEVYWLHQMDLKVCSISIKRTEKKLSHFIINDKLTTTDYFCDSAYSIWDNKNWTVLFRRYGWDGQRCWSWAEGKGWAWVLWLLAMERMSDDVQFQLPLFWLETGGP